MCSDAPEIDPAVGQAARDNVALSREAMAYYRERDKANQPRQDKMDAIAMQLADQSISTSKFNTDAAREQMDRYRATGVPAEDAMYNDAATYDSTARQEAQAGQAATDVDFAVNSANDARRRTMARAGVNPADGRALSMEADAATAAGLGKAAAMNGARTRVQDQGIMLRKDAANFARGMSGTAAQTFGTAAAAGAGASGAIGSAIGTANASTGTMGQGFGIGIQGNQSGASILNQEYQLKAANQGGGIGEVMGGLGALGKGLGSMGFVLSDENQKEGVTPAGRGAALDGVMKLGVKKWRYKGDSPAADGGQEHVGPMAQDVRKHLGDTVAPGGKAIDVASAIGTSLAAIQALNKKVDKLAAKKEKA